MKKCGDCIHAELCERIAVDFIQEFSRDNPAYCKSFQDSKNYAEVIHAHWEDGCAIHNGKEVYKSIDCSHCNEIFKTDDREYWKARFKVCPFCGAKMDGGNDDGSS